MNYYGTWVNYSVQNFVMVLSVRSAKKNTFYLFSYCKLKLRLQFEIKAFFLCTRNRKKVLDDQKLLKVWTERSYCKCLVWNFLGFTDRIIMRMMKTIIIVAKKSDVKRLQILRKEYLLHDVYKMLCPWLILAYCQCSVSFFLMIKGKWRR